MPASELMQWSAFEEVYGPILPHERIDVGFAMLAYYLVSLFGKRRRRKVKDFLPPYWQDRIAASANDPEKLRAFFEGLIPRE